MRTEKEILKDIVDYVNKHSMITWGNKLFDEANFLYKHQSEQLDIPVVVGQSEQLTCECVGLGSTECNKINDKWICCKCNRPLAG
jgi:hypothetical protein